jgi:hypothetical protein
VKVNCGCRFPDREIEESWSSSGREDEGPEESGRDPRSAVTSGWYQSGNIFFFL